jgi:hypothetical protein
MAIEPGFAGAAETERPCPEFETELDGYEIGDIGIDLGFEDESIRDACVASVRRGGGAARSSF